MPRISKTSFFLVFSTIKFMFERSDLCSNFFKHCHVCRHKFNSPGIIFWKSNRARRKT